MFQSLEIELQIRTEREISFCSQNFDLLLKLPLWLIIIISTQIMWLRRHIHRKNEDLPNIYGVSPHFAQFIVFSPTALCCQRWPLGFALISICSEHQSVCSNPTYHLSPFPSMHCVTLCFQSFISSAVFHTSSPISQFSMSCSLCKCTRKANMSYPLANLYLLKVHAGEEQDRTSMLTNLIYVTNQNRQQVCLFTVSFISSNY